MQFALSEALKQGKYQVEIAASAEMALEKLKQSPFDLIFLDIRLPGMSGLEAIPKIQDIYHNAIIIVITAHGSREAGLEAMQKGAYDYLTKPFRINELKVITERAIEKRKLQKELEAYREQIRGSLLFENLIGKSPPMRAVYELAAKVAPTDTTVLIYGESGTGKERLAEEIHARSLRKNNAFVKVNCVAIPEGLLESELFGHEKGAFTGASASKLGKFELADKGTLFLDEIGDMNLNAQAKLLRVLQQREFERVGGTRPIKVDVRIICATNKNLIHAIRTGQFREDLFFRLNVVSINLPPLKERKEDIPLLVDHFIAKASAKVKKNVTSISSAAMEKLTAHSWPGNVRELENCIERAVVVADDSVIMSDDLITFAQMDKYAISMSEEVRQLDETIEAVEKQLILEALDESKGVQAEAAKKLGITERSLWHRVKKYKIDVDKLRSSEQS
jgi:two-component system response regulator AtoC